MLSPTVALTDSRVAVSFQVDAPCASSRVWERMRDLAHFATRDLLHHRIRLVSGSWGPGGAIVIEHRLLGLRLDRPGRILRWREGEGYTFSDLSPRGPRVGFPHILDYRVVPAGTETSRLTVTVRGRWTARFVPRLLIRLWLKAIMAHMELAIRRDLVRFLTDTDGKCR